MKKIKYLILTLIVFCGSVFADGEVEIHREEFVAHFNGPEDLVCEDNLNQGDDIVKLSLDVTNTDMPDDIEHYYYYTFIDAGFESPINCQTFNSLLTDENIIANGLHIIYQHHDNGEHHTYDRVRLILPDYPGIKFFNK